MASERSGAQRASNSRQAGRQATHRRPGSSPARYRVEIAHTRTHSARLGEPLLTARGGRVGRNEALTNGNVRACFLSRLRRPNTDERGDRGHTKARDPLPPAPRAGAWHPAGLDPLLDNTLRDAQRHGHAVQGKGQLPGGQRTGRHLETVQAFLWASSCLSVSPCRTTLIDNAAAAAAFNIRTNLDRVQAVGSGDASRLHASRVGPPVPSNPGRGEGCISLLCALIDDDGHHLPTAVLRYILAPAQHTTQHKYKMRRLSEARTVQSQTPRLGHVDPRPRCSAGASRPPASLDPAPTPT
ncbi:uncharacterized protein PSFLO_05656 [Pseudozyma flocculosa]|uniref:Uncharacterized protein n=1 Tax=Pseudozyma flocculosa TaxID=84751 RepID=A0A5C3F6L5_9BASI|nr:uncharacterized protein PSFLO_05656 [Pseudozyma flocculosa]